MVFLWLYHFLIPVYQAGYCYLNPFISSVNQWVQVPASTRSSLKKSLGGEALPIGGTVAEIFGKATTKTGWFPPSDVNVGL